MAIQELFENRFYLKMLLKIFEFEPKVVLQKCDSDKKRFEICKFEKKFSRAFQKLNLCKNGSKML